MDPREKIAQLEAELAAKDTTIARHEAALASRDELVAKLEGELNKLQKLVDELIRKQGQNSRNSHLPPSKDPPGSRPSKPSKTKRKRGGQRGHKGHHRALFPPERVDETNDIFPDACENCWGQLPRISDVEALRSQVVEVPPARAHVTEFRQHSVCCPRCAHVTRASNKDIPVSPFGPRLMAMVALLTGVYHLSRRKTVEALQDILGIKLSLGAVSAIEGRVVQALAAPYEEATIHADAALVKHTDATTWLQAGVRQCIWVLATNTVSVFKIVADGSVESLRKFLRSTKGILVSDRATVFSFWTMENRQICWAHLLRKFISFSERSGPVANLGNELLDYTRLIFVYWHDFKDGVYDREALAARIAPIQRHFERTLRRAVAAEIDEVSGSCQNSCCTPPRCGPSYRSLALIQQTTMPNVNCVLLYFGESDRLAHAANAETDMPSG